MTLTEKNKNKKPTNHKKKKKQTTLSEEIEKQVRKEHRHNNTIYVTLLRHLVMSDSF